MTQVMKGIRILEVAQFTFVPAAGAVLAEWGADVIKIEHPIRGDTQRGFVQIAGYTYDPARHPLIEHANRGKRSVGLDISTPEGQALLYEIAKVSDVFLTNYLPGARQKLKIDVEHIRAANPNIVYARGTAWGDKGPEREAGGFDSTAFWTRTGIAVSVAPEELGGPLMQGMPAFGDSIGAMYIAGGISAALLHRERTGEATEIDISLMSAGAWSAGAALCQTAVSGVMARNRMPSVGASPGNPFLGVYRTADGRLLNFNILTPGPYLRDTFEHLGIPEAADDPRFSTGENLLKNWADASALIVAAVGKQPFAYWLDRLKTMRGQWAPFQNFAEFLQDEQALANDIVLEVEAIDGGEPVKVIRSPVQFNHVRPEVERSPQASEHTETFLLEVGLEWEEIERLKERKVIA